AYGTAIDRVIDKIGSNAAVIEQSIPLCRRAVSNNRFSFIPRRNQKVKKLTLGFLDLFSKREVVFELLETGGLLSCKQISHSLAGCFFLVFFVAGVNSQRSAMG